MQRQSTQRIRTFTIGFDNPRIDESAHARAVARHLGTEHTDLRVTGWDAIDLLPGLPAIYDRTVRRPESTAGRAVGEAYAPPRQGRTLGDGGDETVRRLLPLSGPVLRMWRRLARWPQALVRGRRLAPHGKWPRPWNWRPAALLCPGRRTIPVAAAHP